MEKLLFLSYSRQERNFADWLVNNLQRDQVEIWFDLQRLTPGSDWRDQIDQALARSSGLILIASRSALASSYVQQEWQHAHAAGKPVYVVWFEPVELPADFHAHPPQGSIDFSRHARRDLDRLKRLLDETENFHEPAPRALLSLPRRLPRGVAALFRFYVLGALTFVLLPFTYNVVWKWADAPDRRFADIVTLNPVVALVFGVPALMLLLAGVMYARRIDSALARFYLRQSHRLNRWFSTVSFFVVIGMTLLDSNSDLGTIPFDAESAPAFGIAALSIITAVLHTLSPHGFYRSADIISRPKRKASAEFAFNPHPFYLYRDQITWETRGSQSSSVLAERDALAVQTVLQAHVTDQLLHSKEYEALQIAIAQNAQTKPVSYALLFNNGSQYIAAEVLHVMQTYGKHELVFLEVPFSLDGEYDPNPQADYGIVILDRKTRRFLIKNPSKIPHYMRLAEAFTRHMVLVFATNIPLDANGAFKARLDRVQVLDYRRGDQRLLRTFALMLGGADESNRQFSLYSRTPELGKRVSPTLPIMYRRYRARRKYTQFNLGLPVVYLLPDENDLRELASQQQ